MSINTCKNIEMIVFYFFIKENPEISFRHGPEHETTSLRELLTYPPSQNRVKHAG